MLDKVNKKSLSGPALAVLGALSMLVCTTASAASYRWVDKDGNVTYSQTRPPPGHEAQVVRPPPPPADPQAAERLREQMLRLENNREDRDLAKEQAGEEKSRVAAREHNCKALTTNIDGVKNAPPNRLVKNRDGTYQRQTEEDKTARLKELQKRYDEECR